MVGRQKADIVDTLHLRDLAMATIFWLSTYWVHSGATCRIRLNGLCGGDAALRQITLTTCYYFSASWSSSCLLANLR